MLIIYKNNLYDLLDEKTHFVIITRLKAKTDTSFLSTGKAFYKYIPKDDADIQDIFGVQFFLQWNSHLKNVEKKWEILTESEYLKGNQVLLKFFNGILPGWNIEEQTVCSKYVDIVECEDFAVKYTYTVKDGNKLKEPTISEQKVSKEEFQKLVIQYQIRNI
ncbi:MAG TPA: hypothetical protein PK033_14820 [Acetivibrio sp.]|nr:hypothetical protein [Acetivibrio sp.]